MGLVDLVWEPFVEISHAKAHSRENGVGGSILFSNVKFDDTRAWMTERI